jgi:hypothetical protein
VGNGLDGYQAARIIDGIYASVKSGGFTDLREN